jgi:hypothetical protein
VDASALEAAIIIISVKGINCSKHDILLLLQQLSLMPLLPLLACSIGNGVGSRLQLAIGHLGLLQAIYYDLLL